MLSNLKNKSVTIINQIPTSNTNSTKKAFTKRILSDCGVVNGVKDSSNGYVNYKNNSFTVFSPIYNYLKADFSDDGYYSNYDKPDKFTVNIGDLVITGEIDDDCPANINEFNEIRQKYSNNGGIITSFQVYDNENKNGSKWNINHIEIIKG